MTHGLSFFFSPMKKLLKCVFSCTKKCKSFLDTNNYGNGHKLFRGKKNPAELYFGPVLYGSP
jgi:hypothetical protein